MFSNGITVMMPSSATKEKDKWKEKEGLTEKVKDNGSEKRPTAEKHDESVCRSSICEYVFPVLFRNSFCKIHYQ